MSLPISIPQPHFRSAMSDNSSDEDIDPAKPSLQEDNSSMISPISPQLSSSFPPLNRRLKFDNRSNYQRYLRKCSYIIAAVESSAFVTSGATMISTGIYMLPRVYDGTATGETCAIIGINKHLVKGLFDRDSDVYTKIKESPLLVDIPGIEDIGPYKLTALRYMIKFLYFIHDTELILFNIEPRGDSNKHNEKRYPFANLCLPGGGMESQDEWSWERAAFREFEEETGFQISSDPELTKLIAKQKYVFPDFQGYYFWMHLKKLELVKVSTPPSSMSSNEDLSPEEQNKDID